MQIRGYIDGVLGGDLVGWVLDEEAPETYVTVEAWVDGRPLAPVRAEDRRADLLRAGIGHGHHGFRFTLDAPLAVGEHGVCVRPVGTQAPLPLANDWVVQGPDEAQLRGVALHVVPVPSPPGAEGDRDRDPLPAADASSGRAAVGDEPTASADAPVVVLAEDADADAGALRGGAGWLYAVPSSGFDRLRGLDPLSHAELDAHVERTREIFDIAADLGAVPVVVVVPDKLFVYRDHLPAGMTVDPEGRPPRSCAGACAMIRSLRSSISCPPCWTRASTAGFSRAPATGCRGSVRSTAPARSTSTCAPRFPGVEPLPMDALNLGALGPVERTLADRPGQTWVDGELVKDTDPVPAGVPDGELTLDHQNRPPAPRERRRGRAGSATFRPCSCTTAAAPESRTS